MKVKKLNDCDLIMPVSGYDDIIQHIMDRTPFRRRGRHGYGEKIHQTGRAELRVTNKTES